VGDKIDTKDGFPWTYPMTFHPRWAAEYGVEPALLLQHLVGCIWANSCQGGEDYECKHDGRIWVKYSFDELAWRLPWWSDSEIKRLMKILIDRGALIKGNYNDHPFDQTSWYAKSDTLINP
jgi:hypothetical protein